MTKELKKRLYCLFVGLIVIAWIIPKSTSIIIGIGRRTGLNIVDALTIANIAFIVVFIIEIILAVAWICKYKLFRTIKSGAKIVVFVVGIIAVAGLFMLKVITFVTMYNVPVPIAELSSGYITLIPQYIAMYLGIVGIWGTYRIKVAEANNAFNSGAYVQQNEATSNHAVGVGEDLRKAIYDKYCEEVKKSLKSPASAIFCNMEELTITDNYGVYVVNGWVDSQNSYGAMIRTNVTLKMMIENGVLVSKTNLAISASGKVAKNLVAYYIIGAILTLISFGFFYFIINGML